MAVYQIERYGMASYAFDVGPGNYRVRLIFTESYYYYIGDRVANININGTQLTNFDILARTGGIRNTASYIDITNNGVGDQIYITFTSVNGASPKINGIAITKL